jgi:hypothetical protein
MENLTQLLSGLGSPSESSPESMSKRLEAAKQKAKDERLLPRVPMTFMSPMIAMAQLFAQRRAWDEGQNDELHQIRQTFIGAELYYSSTPLSSLKPSNKNIS